MRPGLLDDGLKCDMHGRFTLHVRVDCATQQA